MTSSTDALERAIVSAIQHEASGWDKQAAPLQGNAVRALIPVVHEILRAAPPSSEPVAWSLWWPREHTPNTMTTFSTKEKAEEYKAGCVGHDAITVVPLYASPPTTKPSTDKQQPVTYVNGIFRRGGKELSSQELVEYANSGWRHAWAMAQIADREKAAQSATGTPQWKSWTEKPPQTKEAAWYAVLVGDGSGALDEHLRLTMILAHWVPQLTHSGGSNWPDKWECQWTQRHIFWWFPVELGESCKQLIATSDNRGKRKERK